MKKWCGMLTLLGGGWLPEFREDIFIWFEWKIFMINDYAYVRIDFRQDPDMVLLEGEN